SVWGSPAVNDVTVAFTDATLSAESLETKKSFLAILGTVEFDQLSVPAAPGALRRRSRVRILREAIEPPHGRHVDADGANLRELGAVPGHVDARGGILR